MSVNVTSQEITIYNLAVNILDIYLHLLEERKFKKYKKPLLNTHLCTFILNKVKNYSILTIMFLNIIFKHYKNIFVIARLRARAIISIRLYQ